MKRLMMIAVALLLTPPAFAADWEPHPTGGFALRGLKEALVVECVGKYKDTVGKTFLFYYPACSVGCEGTFVHDAGKLATVTLDKEPFAAQVHGGDTQELMLAPVDPTGSFFARLAASTQISIYSSQITPNYVDFPHIGNGKAVADYHEACEKPLN